MTVTQYSEFNLNAVLIIKSFVDYALEIKRIVIYSVDSMLSSKLVHDYINVNPNIFLEHFLQNPCNEVLIDIDDMIYFCIQKLGITLTMIHFYEKGFEEKRRKKCMTLFASLCCCRFEGRRCRFQRFHCLAPNIF